MGCNCKKIEGFDLALVKALSFERSTGKQAAIINVNGLASFTELSNVSKVKGVRCYFTTDRKEHKIPLTKKKVTKKED